MRGVVWAFIAMFVILIGTSVRQAWAQEEEEYRFGKEELVQMLAPIALYPDSLIAQILMASTYPLEVVEAERWLSGNKDLQGDPLYDALREKPWDPSVKALCQFPDVLIAMSEKLDQTRKLGDAFLVQEQEVMDTVQELRRKAMEQGTLQTTEQQKVIVEREIVRIEPASPQVVYVPVYDPYYVYGSWWYPDYPPYYWYYPPRPFVSGVHFAFGPRVFIGLDLFSWVWFDWHVHRIHIDVNRTFRFHKHRIRPSHERFHWRHDPRHRRGVAYRDRRISERFGVPTHRLRAPRSETRGFSPGTGERRRLDSSTSSGPGSGRRIAPESRDDRRRIERRSGPGRGGTSVPDVRREQRRIEPRSGSGSGSRPEVRREQQRIQPMPRRDTPFRGVDDGRFERRSGERGRESRGSRETLRQDERQDSRGGGSRGRGGGSRGRGGDSGGRGGGSRR
jgi:hypothetical protein